MTTVAQLESLPGLFPSVDPVPGSVFTCAVSLRTIQLRHSLRTTDDQKQYASDRVRAKRAMLADLGATPAFIDRDRRTSIAEFALRSDLIHAYRGDSLTFDYSIESIGAAVSLGAVESEWMRYKAEDSVLDTNEDFERSLRMYQDERSDALDDIFAAAGADPYVDDLRSLTALRGDIVEWSARSRANMIKTLASLDYSSWVDETTGLVTVTLPDNWLEVMPDGETFKAAILAFLKRWSRKFGDWCGVWKLEFQHRGAPHLMLWGPLPKAAHLCVRHSDHVHEGPMPERTAVAPRSYTVPLNLPESWEWANPYSRKDSWTPRQLRWLTMCSCRCTCRKPITSAAFLGWARLAWAEIVGSTGDNYRKHVRHGVSLDWRSDQPKHVDEDQPGIDMTDPGDAILYFTKYAGKNNDGRSKEYQNRAPKEWLDKPGSGPGRFWGYRGLEATVVEVHLSQEQYLAARRIMRKVIDSRSATRGVAVSPSGKSYAKIDADRPRRRCQSYGRTQHEHSAEFFVGGWSLCKKGSLQTASRLLEWVQWSHGAAGSPSAQWIQDRQNEETLRVLDTMTWPETSAADPAPAAPTEAKAARLFSREYWDDYRSHRVPARVHPSKRVRTIQASEFASAATRTSAAKAAGRPQLGDGFADLFA